MVTRRAVILLLLTFSSCGTCYDTDAVLLQQPDLGDQVRDVGEDETSDRDAADAEVSDAGGDASDAGGGVHVDASDAGENADAADLGLGPDLSADACTPETASELCSAAAASCGELTTTDTCGAVRVVSCGECPENASCSQNACSCAPGYELDATGCVDVDECSRGTAGCDTNATCFNQPGGFSCSCDAPYVGDGFTCVDTCFNGICDLQSGENYEICPADCSAATAITTGERYSCALVVDGSVRCWGEGLVGQLGHGFFTSSFLPVRALLTSPAVDIGAAHETMCAVLNDGTVNCWGEGDDGELGNNTTMNSNVPVAVANLTGIDHVQGGDEFACGWQRQGITGRGWCWGRNTSGELGGASLAPNHLIPLQLATPTFVDEISLGDGHGCLRNDLGEVYCWGSNRYGQLGDGGTTSRNAPTSIGLSQVREVGVGGSHSCAVMNDGTVKCWGLNDKGQLGADPLVLPTSAIPVDIAGVSDAIKVAPGVQFACALRATGQVVCWGEGDNGQLGNGMFLDSTSIVTVLGLNDAMALDAGEDHMCALRTSGQVVCWGQGTEGQLGTGFNTDIAVPIAVTDW